MYDVRVLITTYHEAFLRRGGGEQELLEVAQRLNEIGVDADVYGHRSRPIDSYDVVLHFSVHGGGLGLLRRLAELRKPIVLWPNLWIAGRDDISREVIQQQLDLASLVIVKSRAELDHLASLFAIEEQRTAVVPAGVDPSYGVPADPIMFRTIYQLDDYVLWPGIIEERKNQLVAIEAISECGIPVVFVGNYRDRSYYEACRARAPSHFKFLPFMPPKSEIYRSAIQNCRAFLEVPLDHPGLSALEGALAGRTLVISDGAWSREHFSDLAIYVDPASKRSIRDGLEAGLSRPPDVQIADIVRKAHLLPHNLEPLARALDRLTAEHDRPA